MPTGSIGMGEQSETERGKFENELKRIIEASNNAGLMLRVIGSLAFQMHCPKYGYLQAAMGGLIPTSILQHIANRPKRSAR